MIEKVREALKSLNLEIVGEYLGRLSQRERYIVLASALGLLILIVVIIMTSALAGLKSTEKKITQLKTELQKINAIRGDFVEIEQEIQRLEGIIKRTGKNFEIATHLEKLAAENGINITSVSPKPAPKNDLYKESQVEVNLRQIYLKNLVQFLYKIENSPQLLRINAISVRPNYSNPLFLNVIFSVSTFEPAE